LETYPNKRRGFDSGIHRGSLSGMHSKNTTVLDLHLEIKNVKNIETK
jgi:hypothetical protein